MNGDKSQFTVWKDLGFTVESTLDGSPTLRLHPQNHPPRVDERPPESMHHSGGAYSESVYIYGQVIEEAMKLLPSSSKEPLRILSLGLGLGYNELLTAATAIKTGHAETFQLLSYETVRGLVDILLRACSGGPSEPSEIVKTQELMFDFFEKDFKIPRNEIKKSLMKAWEEKRWKIEGDFFSAKKIQGVRIFLYDAFSHKTTENLWTEEFLTTTLQECAAQDAIFATYACRASLKRALKASGFNIVVRDGFLGKRNSTQGRRGVF